MYVSVYVYMHIAWFSWHLIIVTDRSLYVKTATFASSTKQTVTERFSILQFNPSYLSFGLGTNPFFVTALLGHSLDRNQQNVLMGLFISFQSSPKDIENSQPILTYIEMFMYLYRHSNFLAKKKVFLLTSNYLLWTRDLILCYQIYFTLSGLLPRSPLMWRCNIKNIIHIIFTCERDIGWTSSEMIKILQTKTPQYTKIMVVKECLEDLLSRKDFYLWCGPSSELACSPSHL